MRKVFFVILPVLLIVLSGFIYYNYFFVFGEGIKAGNLNYVVHKGYIFKTYEGKLIQEGIKNSKTGMPQSNEFEFSVESKELADKLQQYLDQDVKLHYREYIKVVPWRGNTVYVVDRIEN